MASEVLIGTEEAARRIGCSRAFLYELIMSTPPRIPSVKVGKRRLLSVAALERWAEQEIQQQNGGTS